MKIVEIVYAKLQVWSMFILDGAAYFLIAMVGAFVKDIYDTYSGVKTRIEIFHIVVSASLSTFLIFAARNYTGEDLLPAINFILGIVTGKHTAMNCDNVNGYTYQLWCAKIGRAHV